MRLPATLAVLGLLLAIPGNAHASAAADPGAHVVVFGLDGTVLDRVKQYHTPNLKSLIANGYASDSTLYAQPFAPTVSGPGWATIATGVWPDKHQVLNNGWGNSSSLGSYPDFLTRIENVAPSLSTYAIADWSPLTNDADANEAIFSPAIDHRVTISDAPGYEVADAQVAASAGEYLKTNAPNASFVYFGDVDIAGHTCGSANTCYKEAIERTDVNMGTVLDAIRSRPNFPNEKWTFLVTADHGHTPTGGHGGSSVLERSTFVIASGTGFSPVTPALRPKLVDVASTVFKLLGVPVNAAWNLDGRPVSDPSPDPFDTKVGSLQPRVDETGVPADVLGWTTSLPAGWSIDNSAMGTGGVTEWRGWSLTTDAFWTRAAPDQQRESNVRARGVFAVADSDEWSDKTTSGTFNSTLVSAPYDVSGSSSAVLRFSSHYLKSGSETATVSVSFDGGADQQVLSYTSDVVATIEQVSVTVPSGASQMRVKWKLANAGNDWYWAVDEPSVTKGSGAPIVSGGTYTIDSVGSGKVIDVPGSSTTLGTQLIQWSRHGAANQQWIATGNSDGSYTFTNAGNDLCIDVEGGSTSAGAAIIQWTCHGGTNQKWTVTTSTNGGYTLTSVKSGLVITVAGLSNSDTLTQQVNSSSSTQRWTFTRIA